MKDPKQVVEVAKGNFYLIHMYVMEDKGYIDYRDIAVAFATGNPKTEDMRQPGIFVETLIALVKKYLEDKDAYVAIDNGTLPHIENLIINLDKMLLDLERIRELNPLL